MQSLSLLLNLCVFLGLLIHELLCGLLVVRKEVHASHEWLEALGYFDTLWGLVVFKDTAHGSLGGAESGVEHMYVDLIFAGLSLPSWRRTSRPRDW